MNIETSKLTRSALNWAVAKAQELIVNVDKTAGEVVVFEKGNWFTFNPSENWFRGGQLIEDCKIDVQYGVDGDELWSASSNQEPFASAEGSTFLIAAMRCMVANTLGDVVDVPDDVLELDPPEVAGPRLGR